MLLLIQVVVKSATEYILLDDSIFLSKMRKRNTTCDLMTYKNKKENFDDYQMTTNDLDRKARKCIELIISLRPVHLTILKRDQLELQLVLEDKANKEESFLKKR